MHAAGSTADAPLARRAEPDLASAEAGRKCARFLGVTTVAPAPRKGLADASPPGQTAPDFMQTRTGRGAEKRRVARGRVALPARYTSANMTLEGEVTDVSPEGVFFCSDFLDQPGESAAITVELPTRTAPLQVRVEVRWVSDTAHGGGMGLRFTGASLQDRLALSAAAEPRDPPREPSTGNA